MHCTAGKKLTIDFDWLSTFQTLIFETFEIPYLAKL